MKNYKVQGLFVLCPLSVRRRSELFGEPVLGEAPISFEEVLTAFLGERIFSIENEVFVEYDRVTRRWMGVQYDEIVPP